MSNAGDRRAAEGALGPNLLRHWAQDPLEPWPPILDKQAQLGALSGALSRVAVGRKRRAQRQTVLGALAFAASIGGLVFGAWALWAPGGSLQATAPASQAQPAQSEAVARAGVRLLAGSGATMEINGVSSVLSVGSALPEGALLAPSSQAVELRFESGSSARFDAQARVQLVAAHAGVEALRLIRGGTQVEVPPDGRPVVFSVETEAARVVVHGTQFSVQVEPESGRTRVAVTRGRVSVHPQKGEPLSLVAGGSWRSPRTELQQVKSGDAGSESAAESAPSPRAETAHERVARRRARTPRQSRRRLGAENDLFLRAMALKGKGDDRGALERLLEFEQRYPQSLLSQEVRVEHFRVLLRLDRLDQAAEVANDYMRRWPRGFAREEARDVLLGAP